MTCQAARVSQEPIPRPSSSWPARLRTARCRPADTPFSDVELSIPAEASGRRRMRARPAPQAMCVAYQGLLDDHKNGPPREGGGTGVTKDVRIKSPVGRVSLTPDAASLATGLLR
jgi:hypothetical protein